MRKLKNRAQTAAKISIFSKKYWKDLDNYGFLDKPLDKAFDAVKKIPYKEDPEGEEIVARPDYLLDGKTFPDGLDCKKKALILGAWAEAHGIPWRLIGASEQPNGEIHHIFPQYKIDGHWLNVDATYDDYELFEAKPETTNAEAFF